MSQRIPQGQIARKAMFLGPGRTWVLFLILILVLLAHAAFAGDLPPPQIGILIMPPAFWEIIQQEAQANNIDPDLIAAVMAIESRYEIWATNTRCRSYGLMQIQEDVAKFYGMTNPFDPAESIRVGAAILGRLWRKCHGDLLRILKIYNPEDTGAYSREVLRAYRQAKKRRQLCQR